MTVMAAAIPGSIVMAGSTWTPKFVSDTKSYCEGKTVGDESLWNMVKQGVMWNSTAFFEKNDTPQPKVTKQGEEPW
jgi:hypothetical protein